MLITTITTAQVRILEGSLLLFLSNVLLLMEKMQFDVYAT